MLPKPDSPDANRLGCSCPNTVNANGVGTISPADEKGIPIRMWKINPTCKVHSNPKVWYSTYKRPAPAPEAAPNAT